MLLTNSQNCDWFSDLRSQHMISARVSQRQTQLTSLHTVCGFVLAVTYKCSNYRLYRLHHIICICLHSLLNCHVDGMTSKASAQHQFAMQLYHIVCGNSTKHHLWMKYAETFTSKSLKIMQSAVAQKAHFKPHSVCVMLVLFFEPHNLNILAKCSWTGRNNKVFQQTELSSDCRWADKHTNKTLAIDQWL